MTVGERIYVISGLLEGNPWTDRVDIYDPGSDTWTDGPPIQTAMLLCRGRDRHPDLRHGRSDRRGDADGDG